MPSRTKQQERNRRLVRAFQNITSAVELAAKEAEVADNGIQWAPVKALLKLNLISMTTLVLIAGQLQELLTIMESQLPETSDRDESPTD